jgi:hypothetical protein
MGETAKVMGMRPNWGEQKEYEINWRLAAEEHPEVTISYGRQDSIHWFCKDKKFRVLKVDRHEDPDAPLPLFYRRFPDDNPEFGFQVNSGPLRPECMNHTYKAHFEFEDGTKLDPHIRATP